LVLTDVEVEGSDLPVKILVLLTTDHTTSSPALDVVQDGHMATGTTSGTKRTDTLDTDVIVEDAGEDVGHNDEEG